jgi:serine/threonine-protein kinase
MTPCPNCSRETPAGQAFCGFCGSTVAADITRTSIQGAGSSGSWLPDISTSSAGGRFLPGAMIAGRYRVIGLLSRGGMGEVYRADDLKLGRAVALKFLPRALEQDAGRHQRFLNEVRMALQVTHSNVCRVYDVGEFEGLPFLSMEYVDGEDLTSLSRRIGRLPEDKALQVARQLCAGLAAAHEQGILHRDLKPANIMLDGRGHVKITDFGLAGVGHEIQGAEVRVGTPAYMAPEQSDGREVTQKSDLYALGLVLYEIFTGKPAFAGKTPAEMARMHRTDAPAHPSSLVETLDPAIERVILRCLNKNPELRPASALSVAAALPGADPLAAALAAGETPSPEMVADAGSSEGLEPWVAWSALAAVAVLLVALLAMIGRTPVLRLTPPELSTAVLSVKAREIAATLGYADRVDEAQGFQIEAPYLQHIARSSDTVDRWEELGVRQPAALRFWYRQSGQAIQSYRTGGTGMLIDDPPLRVPGSVTLTLDTRGRLLGFEAVPARLPDPAEVAGEPDWSPLFAAAGLDRTAFVEVKPEWTPAVFADRRAAWTGVYPDAPKYAIRVEAAAFRGKPVEMRVVEPWTPRPAKGSTPSAGARILQTVGELFSIVTLIGGALVAWRNLRMGRSDRRGAFRLAVYLMSVRFATWLLVADDFGDGPFFAQLSWSLYRFAAMWIFYVALEPYLRRIWPRTMVSWVRLLDGRLRDPLVGRDLLFGVLAGVGVQVLLLSFNLMIDALGRPLPLDQVHVFSFMKSMLGPRAALSSLLYEHAQFVLLGFFLLTFLLLARLLLRRTWAAVLLWAATFLIVGGFQGPLGFVTFGCICAWYLATFFRLGLLPLMVMLGVVGAANSAPLTLDLSASWASGALIYSLLVLAVAIHGFRVGLAGRPMFRDVLQEGRN